MSISLFTKLKEFHQKFFCKELFLVGLLLLAVGLPIAPFLVGMSQFVLAFSWALEGKLKSKWISFKKNRALQFFLIVMVVHAFGMLYSSDLKYAIHDIKIKLPLLVIPIIVATSYSLNKKDLKLILHVFIATVLVATFVCFAVYLGCTERVITDIRDISIFISHIRFGLMIVFSIFILAYILYSEYKKHSILAKVIYLLAILWLLFFLLVLQSVTSWVVLTILTYVVIITYYKRIKLVVIKAISWFYIVLIPLFIISLLSYVLVEFYGVDKVDYENLPTHTAQGNRYSHNESSDFTENGHYVWLYYSGKELNDYWPQYSDIPFKGKDAKGQPLKYTLVRYLTSKNLPKDAEGLSKLTDEDIKLIEEGYASCVYTSKFTPYIKLYELVWELNQYAHYGNPNSKTISMRIEYSKAGFNILKENILFGVGTGDVQRSFDEYYERTSSKLIERNRRRAHNQYLTFALTFGLVGFFILLFAFVVPIRINKANWTPISLFFLTIVLLSMLNEDTLETQSGATFFAYFYSLLVLRRKAHD